MLANRIKRTVCALALASVAALGGTQWVNAQDYDEPNYDEPIVSEGGCGGASARLCRTIEYMCGTRKCTDYYYYQ